jgi:ribosomal protein S18 acetylase RimI-like enzyme
VSGGGQYERMNDDAGLRSGSGATEAVIRPATVAEVADVLALWWAAGAHPTTTDDAGGVGGLIGRDDGALLVAEVDGELVGTLMATWDGWRGNMYRLVVHPGHRRGGIGRSLVAAGEERLRALGCRRVAAHVVPDDDRAARFWAAVGYGLNAMDRYVRPLDP